MTGAENTEAAASHSKTLFEVVKGNPTPEQVGVLAAVFASASANAQVAAMNPDEGVRNDWGRPAERTRGVFWTSTSAFLDPKFL